ncbi:MAG: DUF6456 domain-containing protein [Pseudomonadota bacterium]
MNKKQSKRALQLLEFLGTGKQFELSEFSDGSGQSWMLSSESGSKKLVDTQTLDHLHKASLIDRKSTACNITDVGLKHLARAKHANNGGDDDRFQAQHRRLNRTNVQLNGATQAVSINLNESPLARLRSARTADGQPWLGEPEFAAGERLRADFDRGQLMQKTTSSWEMRSDQGAKGQPGGKIDLADAAIDARRRVENALVVVGPDLAGVLTDVCCFLKGVQTVERERRWPPRSAKLMLKTGLGLLARHYGTAAGVKPTRLSWD